MILNRLKNFLKKDIAVDLLILFLLGLLSISWFRGNNLINGGDFGMPFDWIKYFKSMFSVWMEAYSLGAAAPRGIASIFPYASFGALMQSLGFSLVLIEKIFFYFWFVGGGLSMYFLCSVLGMKRLGRLIASIFFMLNPFSLIVIWRVSHALIQMPYSFAPLYLGLYIYGLKKKKGLGYIFAFVLIWILTTIPAYAWPAALIIHLIPIFFYFILSLIYFPAERGFILGFTLKLALVFLGLNFYWLFPFVYSISESMAGARSPFFMNDVDTLKLTSVKIIDSIRMLGYWALHSGYKGDPYHPYEAYYRSSAILAISWLIPIMVFLGFLNKDARKKPLFVFFIVTILFGIIGMAGPYSPLGGILMALYKAFPPLALLTRFTILFWGISTYTLFGVLLGYGFIFVYEQGKKFLGKQIFLPILVIAVLLFVVLVWPFWTGEVTARAGKVTPGERVKIPSYWWEAKKWFSEQKGFYRILPLPMSQTYNMIYDWEEGYAGGDPIRWISDNPVIFVNTGESFKIPELIGKIIGEERDFKEAGRLLGMINVKYVLNRKDIVWNYIIGHNSWFAHNPEKIERFLKNQKDLKLVKTFGPWDVYEVAAGDILPHIYIPQKIIGVDGEVESLADLKQFIDTDKEKVLFFSEKSRNIEEKIGQKFVWEKPLLPDEDKKNGITEAVYRFEIKTAGDYEIFLRNDNLWKYYQEAKSLVMQIDNKGTETRDLSILNNNLISLGKLSLSNGSHILIVSLPAFINLADNSSFENVVGADASPDAFEGKLSLRLLTQALDRYVLIPINKFKPGSQYKISFAAKNIKGNPPLLLIWENYLKSSSPLFNGDPNENNYLNISKTNISAVSSWLEFSTVFNSNEHALSGGITFVSPFDSTNPYNASENLFDKVVIQKIFNNPLLLKRVEEATSLEEVPRVGFKKISSSKYEVEIIGAEKPFFLIFSEAFHPQWKLSVPGEHFPVNGFTNGWFVNKTGSFKAIIYFESQILYQVAILFSAVVFGLLSIIIIAIKFKGLSIRDILHKFKFLLKVGDMFRFKG